MNAVSFLKKLEKLEQSVADLYKWFAEIFDDNEAINDIFMALYRQEIKHRDLIALQSRLIKSAGAEINDVSMNPAEIDALEFKIDDYMQGGVFDVKDALDFAIEVEANTVEAHYKLMVMDKYPPLANLMKALVADDEEHKLALQRLVTAEANFSLEFL